jgi:hypothetical protein
VNDPTATRRSSSRHRAALNTVGIVVLILGLAGAGIVFAIGQKQSAGQVANTDGAWQDDTLAPGDSKSFSHDVQMYNGTMGLLVVKWWNLCDALKRPGSVAIMIAAGSAVVAGGCFMAAKRNDGA